MFILEFFLVLFWLLIVPIMIGTLVINQLFKEKVTDFLLASICGVICMLAFFYVLVMPMLFLNMPLHWLVCCWSSLMVVLCVLSLLLNRQRIKSMLCHNFLQIKGLFWLKILIIILVLAQAFVLARYMHTDADDAFYVANATTAVATDSIFKFDPYTGLHFSSYPIRYVLSPFPIFIALLSKLLMIHPAIIAHTILPAVLIPLSYIIFAVLGKKLFPDQISAVLLFIFFLCILNMFGNVSIYTNSTFLLFRIWQGKSVFANIILPAIMYFSFRAMLGEKNFGEWMMLFFCASAACLASSMGIVLAPIMIVCLGSLFAFRSRKLQIFAYSIVCSVPCIACGIISVIM